MIVNGWIRTLSPLSPPATLIADGACSPVDLLEVWLARAGATVEDVQSSAPFAACREMIACVAGAPQFVAATWSCSRWPRDASAC
jgi:hypothetical protein